MGAQERHPQIQTDLRGIKRLDRREHRQMGTRRQKPQAEEQESGIGVEQDADAGGSDSERRQGSGGQSGRTRTEARASPQEHFRRDRGDERIHKEFVGKAKRPELQEESRSVDEKSRGNPGGNEEEEIQRGERSRRAGVGS